MFCPDCGAEYSPGFTRCSDCEVELAADPPPSGSSRTAPHRPPPTPPDVGAYVRSAKSPGWLARRALTVFLVLPPVAYANLAVADVPHSTTVSVVTGLTALLVCWALGERRQRPARPGARLGVFVLACLVYAAALLVVLRASEPRGWEHLAGRYVPLVLVAGLLVQALLSPNAGLRRLPQPLLRWRAPWYVYALALLALPLLAVLVVWLSRHLPGATVDSVVGGNLVGSTLRVGLLEALVAGPWAVAWFGFGVPVLLHRWSALATALTFGLLSWSSSALWFLIHGDAGWPAIYLNLGAVLSLAVIAVWLFQRARGSVWPVLILEGTGAVTLLLNWAGDGFGSRDNAWPALVVAEAALAVLLVAMGRMWQRPESTPFTEEAVR